MKVTRFKADWCVPCRVSAPAFHDFIQESQLLWRVVDVDTEPEYAASCGVQTVPTYVFRDDQGEELSRLVGPQTRAALYAALSQLV